MEIPSIPCSASYIVLAQHALTKALHSESSTSFMLRTRGSSDTSISNSLIPGWVNSQGSPMAALGGFFLMLTLCLVPSAKLPSFLPWYAHQDGSLATAGSLNMPSAHKLGWMVPRRANLITTGIQVFLSYREAKLHLE